MKFLEYLTPSLALTLTLSSSVQDQSHTQVHQILELGSSICTQNTHLYYPSGYQKLDQLEQFQTCTSPLQITVLESGELQVQDASGIWIGRLTPAGTIRPNI